MSAQTERERVDQRHGVAAALGIEDLTVHTPPIHIPWQVTPAEPKQKGAYLDMLQALLVLSEQPTQTGLALFSSQNQWPVYPQVGVGFPRQEMGQSYIVEFHLYLNQAGKTYDFRVFDGPLGGYEDVSIPGGQSHVITHLVPPVDGIPASNDPVYFGASIQQRNTEADEAGWYFYAAEIVPQND